MYVAQPPLYSTKVSNSKTVYLLDDAAKEAFLASSGPSTIASSSG